MTQFDKITYEVSTSMYPGRFCAKVVAWHRGVAVYEKEVSRDASFRSVSDDLADELRIVASMVNRGKLTADPVELPPTTRKDG